MSARHVIIIGAGFGGMLCGRILSRRGFDVTVLEQGRQPGGALQTSSATASASTRDSTPSAAWAPGNRWNSCSGPSA